MKEQFLTPTKWSKNTQQLFNQINEVVNEYQEKDLKLTLRQLYYQLVSRGFIENKIQNYKKVGNLVNDARYFGLIDWAVIEDRIRTAQRPLFFADLSDSVLFTKNLFRLDRWQNQTHYLEVWVEKDALSGVLEPITEHYDLNLMVNRGYTSASAMHEAAKRFREQSNKYCHILYLGDHDPSGLDMVRDIEKRLDIFNCDVQINRLALNLDQIRQYNPPPNPAKTDDPRYEKYDEEFGGTSWELDALKPEILNEILESNILKYLEIDKFNEILKQESENKTQLETITEAIT